MNKIVIRLMIVTMAALGLSACGSLNMENVLPEKRVEYKKARQSSTALEVPPDLSSDTIGDGGVYAGPSPAVTTYSAYKAGQRGQAVSGSAGGARGVLPQNPQIEIRRDGSKRWLVINGSPDAVWDKTLDFWQDNGILLVEQDPASGVMRTSWIENRANIKSDFITNFLRKSLDSIYSTGTRDQFQIRLERGPGAGQTELYLTHSAMEEKLVSGPTGGDGDRGVWTPKGSDPEIEAIMLQKLMVYMGASEQRASSATGGTSSSSSASKNFSTLTTGSSPLLQVHTDFPRAWRLVGIALGRVGFTVEDRNRTEGDYYVRYNDPSDTQPESKGWMSKMAFWRSGKDVDTSKRYIIKVSEQSSADTAVTVNNDNGSAAPAATASRILTLLNDQLR